MQLSKRPIVLYDGVLKQLQGNDNVGKHVMTVVSKSLSNDNDELFSFEQVHVDTSSGGFTLRLPQSPEVGDFIKILDIKSVFSVNALSIDPNSKNIEGSSNILDLDVSGAVVDFMYSGEDDGWILDIGGKNLNIFDDSIQYNIAASTAEVGSRVGRTVYQTGTSNTVELANANNHNSVPAFGVIVYDGDTYVKVRTKAGSVVDMKFDSESTFTPGDHVFLSDLESGKVRTITDTDDSVSVYQRLGTCNDNPSEGYIKVNMWPNPEIYT